MEQKGTIPYPGTLCTLVAWPLTGKTPKDTRTSTQLKALEDYVKDFHRRFPQVRIIGHNEIAAKACPSFDVQAWLRKIGINQ